MTASQAEELGQANRGVRPREIGVLPLVHPILTALQMRQLTDELVPSEADIDLGRIIELLIFNRLVAPQPLYRVQDWLAKSVLPEMMDIAPAQVHNNRLGRALDRPHPHRGDLWARAVGQAIKVYDLDLNVLHWDITSIYFEGAYTDSEVAACGYSRDHRPDTKQVNLEVDASDPFLAPGEQAGAVLRAPAPGMPDLLDASPYS